MKLFSRRRMVRGLVIYVTLVALAGGLTLLERRRLRGSATVPNVAAQPGPLDGTVLLADIQHLAGSSFEGRRTGTAGSRAAQEFIVERFRSMHVLPAFDSYRQPFAFTRRSIKGLFSPSRRFRRTFPEAVNVGGVIRGTSQPERFIALTAHYDGLGMQEGQLHPGADDNASGVAVMLAAGRALAKHPLGHSVLLLAFDAEELGLSGARHFVEHSPVDLALIDVVVNLDMVGRGDTNVLIAAGPSRYPALEAPIRAAAAERGIQVVFGHDRPFYVAGLVEDWTQSSDHGPFHTAGVPFVYLGVEDHADFHEPTDTADRIPPRFLGEAGNLVLSLMRRLDVLPNRR